LVVPFNKALFFLFCFFVVANSGYFTVFTTHIYFIILISMNAGNLVEIRFPMIQSRKCLRKFNFNEIRSPKLSAYNLPVLVLYEPSVINGAHTPRMVVTE
jgi:hypothetical protein